MLFNSAEFVLIFLPVTLAGFALLRRFAGLAATKLWIVGASFAFYSWWHPENLPILLFSMAMNHVFGRALERRPVRWLLVAGVMLNCALLGYFKYTAFAVATANGLFDAGWTAPHIVLPLGISFYTFQQIAYLVDAHAGRANGHGALDYAAFVSFFPQLISGPITHHRELIPQMNDPARFRLRWDSIAIGATIFLIGLFKKVLVADPFGKTVNPIFAHADTGHVAFVEAWVGALSYALQMYFDFSGYSDMAVGLGLLFGLALPINFNSPFKARNVIDYWSRWHITLTRFLTAYIYNPLVLALTRRRLERGLPLPRRGRMSAGAFAQLVAGPTMVTMLVSGIWHGAGWQFVIFGVLHGAFLVVAHGWHALKAHYRPERKGDAARTGRALATAGSVLLTFLCATVALVFFRAPSVAAALDIVRGMVGLNGVVVPPGLAALPIVGDLWAALGARTGATEGVGALQFARIFLFLGVVWGLPNTYEWLRDYPTALGFKAAPPTDRPVTAAPAWRPRPAIGVALGAVSFVGLLYSFSAAPTEFIYFQF